MTDLYLSADVEADGKIPGPFSMLSFGLIAAATYDGTTFTRLPLDPGDTFYRELRPISKRFDPAALAVSGLDRDALVRDGADPSTAMGECADWIDTLAARFDARPVFVAFPLGFDWMFTYWYLVNFARSPFGHSAHLDIKTMYAHAAQVPVTKAVKGRMPRSLLSRRPHTHHALDDAREQAELFANIFEWHRLPRD